MKLTKLKLLVIVTTAALGIISAQAQDIEVHEIKIPAAPSNCNRFINVNVGNPYIYHFTEEEAVKFGYDPEEKPSFCHGRGCSINFERSDSIESRASIIFDIYGHYLMNKYDKLITTGGKEGDWFIKDIVNKSNRRLVDILTEKATTDEERAQLEKVVPGYNDDDLYKDDFKRGYIYLKKGKLHEEVTIYVIKLSQKIVNELVN